MSTFARTKQPLFVRLGEIIALPFAYVLLPTFRSQVRAERARHAAALQTLTAFAEKHALIERIERHLDTTVRAYEGAVNDRPVEIELAVRKHESAQHVFMPLSRPLDPFLVEITTAQWRLFPGVLEVRARSPQGTCIGVALHRAQTRSLDDVLYLGDAFAERCHSFTLAATEQGVRISCNNRDALPWADILDVCERVARLFDGAVPGYRT